MAHTPNHHGLWPILKHSLPLCTIGLSLIGGAGAAEDDDPARPSAIETVNVPVTPGRLFADLLPYQSVRQASFAGWAPDGRGMLIRTRLGEAAQMYRVYRPGGRLEQVTFFSEPTSGYFIPAGKQGDLILTMSRNGNERNQLYLLEPKAYRVTLLTDGRSRHTLGPFSPDGRRMIVRNNNRNGSDMDVYVAETRRRKSLKRIHLVTDEYWYASHWSNDSEQLLMWRRVSAVESYPAVFDFSTNKLAMLPTATKDPAFYTNLRFSPDGREVYMTTDAFSEFHELVVFDRETGKYTRLTADIPWDVEETTIDRKTGAIAFTVNQEGTSRLFVREHGGTRREFTLPSPCIVSDVRFSTDGKQLGLTLHSPTAPWDVFSIELTSGKLTRWTHSVTGGLNPNSFVEPTLVSYPSFDGRKISAFVYRPPEASPDNPVPVIITVHGGPASQYRPVFSSRIQYYVGQLGCAVICPNVRGSRGYGKTFVNLDNGMKREDSVRDIGALLDWIVSQKDLDAKHVAITGRSYGGYMVLASLVHYGDRLRAGIEAAGIANFATFLERTEPYRQDRRRVEYGDERTEEIRAFFDRIAPSRNAAKIQTPLLVVHGVNDPRVPFSEAQKIVDRLISLDRDVWALYVGNEGHSFRKRSNTDYIRVVEVLFLHRHLGLRNVE